MVLTGVLLSVEGVPQLSGRAVAVMAWLVIGSSAVGFALMYHALRRLTNVELSSMTTWCHSSRRRSRWRSWAKRLAQT